MTEPVPHVNGKSRELLEAQVRAKLKRKIQTGRLSKEKREQLRKTLSESTKIILEGTELDEAPIIQLETRRRDAQPDRPKAG